MSPPRENSVQYAHGLLSAAWQSRRGAGRVGATHVSNGCLRRLKSMNASGRLVCVGLGLAAGAHLTEQVRTHIERADVVFVDAPHTSFAAQLMSMHPDVRCLGCDEADPSTSAQHQRAFVDTLLQEVRRGRSVCAAFFGHPTLSGRSAAVAIQLARAEGYAAHMAPGISIEDSLYADLAIDPTLYGCQHYDAHQLVRYRRSLDSSAYLMLWNAAHPPETTPTPANTLAYRKLLLEALSQEYPADHIVLVYKPALDGSSGPEILRLPLMFLAEADIGTHACVVIPPAAELLPEPSRQARLAELLSS